MGLCKCPKRKVTNQFCFEHRVNVCEHCMVNKHNTCVVRSYLKWLDSDYNPCCKFCNQDLSNEACVRLTCYDVFHWVCLDNYARQLPASTAPAGYTCPSCNDCLFPPENLLGPVADALRETLKEVNWARAGLGLHLLEEKVEKRPEFNSSSNNVSSSGAMTPSGPRPTPEGGFNNPASGTGPKGDHLTRPLTPSSVGGGGSGGDQIIAFDTPTNRLGSVSKDYHRVSANANNDSTLLHHQHQTDDDDDKYKRKSTWEVMIRWAKSLMAPSARRRGSKVQRYAAAGIAIFLAFAVVVILLSHLSKSGDFDDPMLEPMNNPNIRVAPGKM